MSWCLSIAAGLNASVDFNQRSEPCTFRAPQRTAFSTSETSPWPADAFFGSLLVSINVSDIVVTPRDISALYPDLYVLTLPAQVGICAFQDRCLETIGRLELEVEQ